MTLFAILIYLTFTGAGLYIAWRIVNYDPSKSKRDDDSTGK
jgi:hypothetical protein